jgi:hypothetical protein
MVPSNVFDFFCSLADVNTCPDFWVHFFHLRSPLASPRRARYTGAMLRCFAVVLALVWAVRVCAGPDDD